VSTRRPTSSLGRRPLGCALEAQRPGASAVFATLWPVADGSTGRFMQLVYAGRQADETLPKGDALRRAQLAFLRGEGGGSKQRDARLAHPFYWAPYVLMGNWL